MRKGISLVALVITIIVLIILTAAVFLTGADVPANAELSVFYQDVGMVQDAVVLNIAENLAVKYGPVPEGKTEEAQDAMTKFEGIVANDQTTIGAAEPTGEVATIKVNGEDVAVWTITAEPTALGLSMTKTDLEKYAIDVNGTVYYYNGGAGKTIDGVSYYKYHVEVE